jgi:drug/metabolite transporter (DMT)-like permease
MKDRAALFGVTDLLLLATVCIWAVNFIVIKNVIGGALPPIAFTALRFVVASLVLLPLLRGLTPAERAVNSRDRRKIVGLGLIGNTLYQIFFIIALANTLPTNAALILATPPVFIALIGALFKLEKLTALAWLGIFMSFGGIALVILGNAPAEISSSAVHPVLGDLLALGAAIMWALYTLLAAPVLQRHSPIKLTALTVAVGTVPLLAIATPSFLVTDWASVGLNVWLGVLYCGGLAIALGYIMWNRAVQQVGAARTAVYSNLTPVLVALIAWLVRGDPLTMYHVVGAIIILTGITLTRLGRRPPRLLSPSSEVERQTSGEGARG